MCRGAQSLFLPQSAAHSLMPPPTSPRGGTGPSYHFRDPPRDGPECWSKRQAAFQRLMLRSWHSQARERPARSQPSEEDDEAGRSSGPFQVLLTLPEAELSCQSEASVVQRDLTRKVGKNHVGRLQQALAQPGP